MAKKPFYITTPLYYSSGKLHLGHCYTSVTCDSIARFKRKDGFDVFFLTGTDEHGQNIAKRAEEKGLTPKQFVDALYKQTGYKFLRVRGAGDIKEKIKDLLVVGSSNDVSATNVEQ